MNAQLRRTLAGAVAVDQAADVDQAARADQAEVDQVEEVRAVVYRAAPTAGAANAECPAIEVDQVEVDQATGFLANPSARRAAGEQLAAQDQAAASIQQVAQDQAAARCLEPRRRPSTRCPPTPTRALRAAASFTSKTPHRHSSRKHSEPPAHPLGGFFVAVAQNGSNGRFPIAQALQARG